ncbi:MAG: bifunctional metallophosphatase/5'-nucleotidase [Ruminococcaceae bacterium]|nr:bifunctional metallophosphatase/5'-nucleotidase [Oscillospiraceae bacterium]
MKISNFTKFISVIISIFLFIGCFVGCSNSKNDRTKDIAVIYTGDVHCAVDENIGYAGLYEYKKSLINDGCEVILVDTGDAIQGDAIGSFSEGLDIIGLMNELGYDAMTLGNHEFDYGGLKRVEELANLAKFPFLSLNFIQKDTNKAVHKEYTIIEKDGIKIAFLGITTPETITSSTPSYFMNEKGEFIYDFLGGKTGKKLYKAVQESVNSARKEGADYVIAMTHLGIDETSEPFTSNSLIANTTGIDAVLDGHSHSIIECARVKNKDGERVLLSATGSKLERIGVLFIEKDGNVSTGLVSSVESKSESFTKLIEDVKNEYTEKLETVIGTLKNELVDYDPSTNVRIIRNDETNLGDFCADAYRKIGDSDIAFANGGGIRTSLKSGDVTYGDITNVHPFNNLLCKANMNGQMILDALEFSVSKTPNESGGFLQVSGLSFEYNTNIESPVILDEAGMFKTIEGERRVQNVMVGDTPIDPQKNYTVVLSNYMLKNSGDGYSMFKNCQIIMDEFIIDSDALVEYLKSGYNENSDEYINPYGSDRITAVG